MGEHVEARRARLFALMGIVAAAWAVVYLGWRLVATRDGANPTLFWALLAAEGYGVASFLMLVHNGWKLPPRRHPRPQRRYSVDVIVTTYDESVEVLEATLAGCAAITYPHRTYLLDDGRRAAMRQLAHRMGAQYVTRSRNTHAKAGNINAALGRLDGELLLILDADHVPLPNVLDETVGYFDDPLMAVVQTPHDFYNRDSVQHSDARRHEQSLFYEVIAPGKDRHGAAYWCGSAAVIRRAALDDVGGVLTDTIAEDFHTTLAMHERGWRSAYHREVLVQGLAPHDLDSFLLQRDRWARGNLTVLRTLENPLTAPGLSAGQRLSYLGSLLSYGSGLYRLTLFAVLTATLATGALPLSAGPRALFMVWLPWMLLTTLGSLGLARGTVGLADTWRYGLLTMGIFTRAVLAVAFGRRARGFKVTPKSGLDAGGWRVVRSLGLLSAVTLALAAGIVLRLAAITGVVSLPRMPAWAEWTTIALAAWTIALVFSAVLPLVHRRQQRASWRFPVAIAATHAGEMLQIVDLTPDGAAVLLPERVAPGTRLDLGVRIPGPGDQERNLVLELEVRSCREHGSAWRAGGRFRDLAPGDRALLVHYCFVVAMTGTLGSELATRQVAVEDRPVRRAYRERVADAS